MKGVCDRGGFVSAAALMGAALSPPMHRVCLSVCLHTCAVTSAGSRQGWGVVWWQEVMPVVQLEMGNLILVPEEQECPSDSCITGTAILVSLYRKQSLGQSPSFKGMFKIACRQGQGQIFPSKRKWECFPSFRRVAHSPASLRAGCARF